MKNVEEGSSGVQELIDKLRNRGVKEGKDQADLIVTQAQKEASDIVAKANSEADKILSDAHAKIEIERNAAHEAIKIAFRDTELALRSKFREAFSTYLKRLVSLELQDKDFIRQLILSIAGMKPNEVDNARQIEVHLPANIYEEDDKGVHLTEEGNTKLRRLVLGITGQMLREGVDLKTSADIKGGIRVKLAGDDINIDLTDDALSALLLKYLLPRYRSIVSGQE